MPSTTQNSKQTKGASTHTLVGQMMIFKFEDHEIISPCFSGDYAAVQGNEGQLTP